MPEAEYVYVVMADPKAAPLPVPEPKSIFTTGSPKLPVHNWAFTSEEQIKPEVIRKNSNLMAEGKFSMKLP